MPCGSRDDPVKARPIHLAHPQRLKIKLDRLLVQDAHHHALAVDRRTVLTRMSTFRPSNRSVMCPSCGTYRSAMSIPDMILMRLVIAACSALGGEFAAAAHRRCGTSRTASGQTAPRARRSPGSSPPPE